MSTPLSAVPILNSASHPNSSSLPDLSGDYALTPAQISDYQQNGHLFLRQVATPEEITAYRPFITEAALRFNTETRPLGERDTYGKAFLQIINLWERDEAVRRFVLARRFAKIAAELMGVPAVRLYHDQALYKEPGGGTTPWHQDEHYWPLDTDKCITLWMPLVPVREDVGGMTFGSGSHRLGYLGDLSISDKSDAVLSKFLTDKEIPLSKTGAMAAGDATFHAGWTLHNAPGNPTDTMREVMTIIYFADGSHLLPEAGIRGEGDLNFFPGIGWGAPAVSPLNPLLYPSE